MISEMYASERDCQGNEPRPEEATASKRIILKPPQLLVSKMRLGPLSMPPRLPPKDPPTREERMTWAPLHPTFPPPPPDGTPDNAYYCWHKLKYVTGDYDCDTCA